MVSITRGKKKNGETKTVIPLYQILVSLILNFEKKNHHFLDIALKMLRL